MLCIIINFVQNLVIAIKYIKHHVVHIQINNFVHIILLFE